jgi:hypothetical protein
MLNLITESQDSGQGLFSTLDEIAREGARKMLVEALNLEVAEHLSRHSSLRDDHGRALVVRNGKANPRKVTLGSGTVEITAPRVNDRRPGEKFTSKILPPYLRRSAKVENLLPILYLKVNRCNSTPKRQITRNEPVKMRLALKILGNLWECALPTREVIPPITHSGCFCRIPLGS